MSEATYTRHQLVTEAAQNLLLIGDGGLLEDEHEDYIDMKVDALFAQLAADSIIEIDDDDEIPAEYFTALGKLLANDCATKFGVQYSSDVKLTFERQLSKTAASRPTSETMRSLYY